MAPPPFPPKPKIGPLIRRSLFVAAMGTAACTQPRAMRIGAVRIGPTPIEHYDGPPDAGAPLEAIADAAFAKPPPAATDAAPAVVQPAADAARVRHIKEPIRIGMYRPPIRIGPPVRDPIIKEPIRIGPEIDPDDTTLIRGHAVDSLGQALSHASLRFELRSGTRIVSTDAAGAFSLDGLPPGEYEAAVRASGFAPVTVQLTADRTGAVATVTLGSRDGRNAR